MTQEGKNLAKTAEKVEIDGEVAARKAGSDSSQKAMQEINQEMAGFHPTKD